MRLPDFALEVHLAKWEFSVRYHMTASDAESLSLDSLLAMATTDERNAFDRLWLGYTETVGAPDLREAIATTYQRIEPQDVLCFAGAEEGLYVAMQALLQSDDHAIVVTPGYQSAESVPLSICATTGVPLDPDDGWSLDIDRVAAALRPNTRVVAINFPHNPTGTILSRDRFDALVELCRSRGIYLFSDEVYRLLGPTGACHLPPAVDAYERGLSLNVMSKAYGLPGLRIGWIACTDRALLQRMERMKHYLSICNSAPSERLAVIALRNSERIIARNCTLVSSNLSIIERFFSGWQDLFEWHRPEGGCVAYPRYLGKEGVERFARELLEESGILVLPASVFASALGGTLHERFRIGFGRDGLAHGIGAFERHLAASAHVGHRNSQPRSTLLPCDP